MKRFSYTKLVIGVLVLGLLLGIVVVRPLVAARGESGEKTPVSLPNRPAQAVVTGLYAGPVALEGVFTGVFSDPTAATPIAMGQIQLALDLEASDGAVSGYVALDHTLVFTGEHEIDGQAVGPRVSGTFDGSTLQLVSEAFSQVMSPGRTLQNGRILPERRATRQFRLVSTHVQADGTRLEGEYRETVWGLTPQPVTVVGTFNLVSAPQEVEYEQVVYLPLVLKDH